MVPMMAEKGLEMRPVGAPHGVALRYFLRNEVPAAGLVPIMAGCSVWIVGLFVGRNQP